MDCLWRLNPHDTRPRFAAHEPMSQDSPAAPDPIEAIHRQSFGYALFRLSTLFRASLDVALEGSGIHMGQVLVLATLSAQHRLHGESRLTQTDLARVTGIEKSSLVNFLDALEAGGWVERRRHPHDRRAHIVELTRSGAARFEQVGIRLYERQQASLAPLDAGEQAAIHEMIARLIAHLEAPR